MPGDGEKGAFRADIPGAAIEEALRSVEKRGTGQGGAEGVEVAEEPAGEAVEAARLAAQLELSLQKGRETMEKLREEHDRFLRGAADLENYKKRAARERDETRRFANEQLLKDLIPVLDNLERALQSAPEGDSVARGVRLVLRSFEEALGRHGVQIFSAMGQPFDPQLHEALLQVARADRPPGTVVMEHGRGFRLQGRLVRPAMVGVAVAPVPAPAGSGDSVGPADGAGPEGAGAA